MPVRTMSQGDIGMSQSKRLRLRGAGALVEASVWKMRIPYRRFCFLYSIFTNLFRQCAIQRKYKTTSLFKGWSIWFNRMSCRLAISMEGSANCAWFVVRGKKFYQTNSSFAISHIEALAQGAAGRCRFSALLCRIQTFMLQCSPGGADAAASWPRFAVYG
jgi:hypothetical protein